MLELRGDRDNPRVLWYGARHAIAGAADQAAIDDGNCRQRSRIASVLLPQKRVTWEPTQEVQ